jgi:hypothetical protein
MIFNAKILTADDFLDVYHKAVIFHCQRAMRNLEKIKEQTDSFDFTEADYRIRSAYQEARRRFFSRRLLSAENDSERERLKNKTRAVPYRGKDISITRKLPFILALSYQSDS